MVTAGLYMVTRTNVIFQHSQTMMLVVAVVGGAVLVAIALLAGAFLPAVVAAVLAPPTLRLSGVYLAMATLAFGEVVDEGQGRGDVADPRLGHPTAIDTAKMFGREEYLELWQR